MVIVVNNFSESLMKVANTKIGRLLAVYVCCSFVYQWYPVEQTRRLMRRTIRRERSGHYMPSRTLVFHLLSQMRIDKSLGNRDDGVSY